MDINGSVFVLLRLEGLSSIVKVELLGNGVEFLPLEDEISASSDFNCSSRAQCSDDVEWSSNVESEVGAHAIFLHCNFLLGVDNIPLLMLGFGLGAHGDSISFDISLAFNLDDFTLDVDEHVLSESVDLEPVTGSLIDIDLVSISLVSNVD